MKSLRLLSVLFILAVFFTVSCADVPHLSPMYSLPAISYAGDTDIMSLDTDEEFNTERFDHITENPFLRVKDYPLSTFSIDVDTAGYSIVRRDLENSSFRPNSWVRIEELINYFDYNYAPPTDGKPFRANVETAVCPWNTDHLLARVAIKGKEFPVNERPKVNLVFLLDVSGSMEEPNKLPLVKSAMKILLDELNGNDRVAICVYAGAAGTVLPPTRCDQKDKILKAMNKLQSGGSTAGGAGIQLAYKVAEENFDPGSINRVILCTDGDFNVGITSRSDLIDLIQAKAKTGVYLSVFGFGMYNYDDGTLKQLATRGNGNYGYIDTELEAKKIFRDQITGTLITIANDVKIQIEFNPNNVGAYRLIGYENRVMRNSEFNDDMVDAGDIGAGHRVTAFYELIPPGSEADSLANTDPLKYSAQPEVPPSKEFTDELLTVKIRYKEPRETVSELISFPVKTDSVRKAGEASEDFTFAASVAAFGMLLRNSSYKGSSTYAMVLDMAKSSLGQDSSGYRAEYIKLVEKAMDLAKR